MMNSCSICGLQFKFPYLLIRHHKNNKRCKEIITFTNTIDGLKKREEKYYKLKELSRQLFDDKKLLEQKNKKLLSKIKSLEIKLSEIKHKNEIAESKCGVYEKMSGNVNNNSNNSNSNNIHNTKIINNNNTIIQDFSIKPASAFDVDTKELTDVIYNKDILEVCKYMFEKYYWTIPPNIRVADQARKKIYVSKGNKWVQENVKELSHQLFHKSLKPMAYRCIKDKIDEHKDFVDNPINVLKPDERDNHFDELLKWDIIKQLWDDFDTPNLQGTLMMSVDNLTNELKD